MMEEREAFNEAMEETFRSAEKLPKE